MKIYGIAVGYHRGKKIKLKDFYFNQSKVSRIEEDSLVGGIRFIVYDKGNFHTVDSYQYNLLSDRNCVMCFFSPHLKEIQRMKYHIMKTHNTRVNGYRKLRII